MAQAPIPIGEIVKSAQPRRFSNMTFLSIWNLRLAPLQSHAEFIALSDARSA
jgi:hypothetical protein